MAMVTSVSAASSPAVKTVHRQVAMAFSARSLSSSAGSSIETLYTLMDGSLEALEFAVSASFTKQGVELNDLDTKPGILIAGIIRGSRTIIPKGSDAILPNDKVIVIAAGERLCDLSDILQ